MSVWTLQERAGCTVPAIKCSTVLTYEYSAVRYMKPKHFNLINPFSHSTYISTLTAISDNKDSEKNFLKDDLAFYLL